MKNIEKAIELNNILNSDHLFTLALCYFAKGDYSNCETSIKEFLSTNPTNKYALHILGFTQLDLDQPKDGLKTLTNLVKNDTTFYPAYNHIGYANLKLNQNEKAINSAELYGENFIDSINKKINALKK